MKKILLAVAMTISFNAFTQLPTTKKALTFQELHLSDDQIETAITTDEGLQTDVINGLKEDSLSKTAVETLEKKSMGSKSKFIKSLFSNKDLAKKAIEYVKNNKGLLDKAKKIVGL
jgi:hypothetical protein